MEQGEKRFSSLFTLRTPLHACIQMPHPFLLLLGATVVKKTAIIGAVRVFGWPKAYRLLMRSNRALFSDKNTQDAVRDGVQRAIRLV
jgi:hypothetical protein